MLACITPFMKRFEALKVDAIVIACNTCFINLKPQLIEMTKIPVIGFEPSLKEAAERAKSEAIVVCCDPRNLEK